jgi:hypothetical protein
MRMMIRTLYLILGLTSGLSHAAQDWMLHNVIVEEVSIFEHNTTEVLRVRFSGASAAELASIGCAPTAAHQVAGHWFSSGFSSHQQMLASALWAAQAQGAPVDLFIDSSRGCDTNTFHQNVENDPTPGLGVCVVAH